MSKVIEVNNRSLVKIGEEIMGRIVDFFNIQNTPEGFVDTIRLIDRNEYRKIRRIISNIFNDNRLELYQGHMNETEVADIVDLVVCFIREWEGKTEILTEKEIEKTRVYFISEMDAMSKR